VLLALACYAADWPMWQHDAGRSAATDESVPDRPSLLWSRQFPPLLPCWEDPVNQDRMPFDAAYEPVVAGTTLVFASNRDDSVTALDTRSGNPLWQALTDAPVRLPPVLHDGRVHAVSDDGWLYTWALGDGRLLWRVRGGRDDRRVLGNGRLVSAWCARGGPVLVGETVYFGAGIWPFMGTTIRALDSRTGDPVWSQGLLGDLYLKHPHAGAEAFGALAPQGAFAASGDQLVVPNGRALPATLERSSGDLRCFHLEGSVFQDTGEAVDRKLEGGSYVCTDGRYLVNRRGVATALYDGTSGNAYMIWKGTYQPVLSAGLLLLGGDTVRAIQLQEPRLVSYEAIGADKKPVTRKRWELATAWDVAVDGSGALMRAGNRLYAAAKGQITAIDLAATPPTPLWTLEVEGTVTRLIAADQRLFAVTTAGRIFCFGAGTPSAPAAAAAAALPAPANPDHPYARLAADLALPLGWALAYEVDEPTAIEALLTRPGLRLAVVNRDPQTVAALRRHLLERGLYGERATVHLGTVLDFRAPAYLALLTVVGALPADADVAWLQALYASVRPYGGKLFIAGETARLRALAAAADLPGAALAEAAGGLLLSRAGALAGAASWTHLYGDATNAAKSDDARVRAPLGLLWFGGNSHQDVLPRHGHGPGEQVVGGRLFIQGINTLSARDVYTGAVLWRREFADLGTAGVYYDSTYCPDPLDLTYNQRHIPGANARGANLAATPDRVYLLAGRQCLALDPADGHTVAALDLPADAATGQPPDWGYLGVSGNVLIGGTGYSAFSQVHGIEKGELSEDYDVSSSRGLAAFDRHTGAVLWTRPARLGFRHNAICASADTLYCIDALPSAVGERLKRRGRTPTEAPKLLALDLQTGRERWQRSDDVFGTWLSVSSQHGVLLQTGRASRDALKDESAERLQALRATDGALLWDRKGSFGGPVMLHGKTIYTSAVSTSGGAVDLLTGDPMLRPHPLTRQPIPWSYHRRYGCNAVIASEYLLTFRSGAAGYYDLARDSGTANLGGFKSGCTSNLIVADGVLNAPDYTRTCTCSYQNQTSLALVSAPDIDSWTANDIPRGNGRILDLAVNLGAPGDRREAEGPLWFEFPLVGGPSPSLPITIEGAPLTWFRHPSADFTGELAWIAASGVQGEARLTVDLLSPEDRLRHVRLPVASPRDDAEEANGAMIHASGDLELVRDKAEQTIGIRFEKVPLAPGDALATACLCFTVDAASDEVTEVVIRAQAADDAAPLGTAPADLTSRPLSTAEVRWIVPPWPTPGATTPAQRSPDLAPLLREISARPGWKPGQAIAFIISGRGRRVARSADHAAGGAPVLDLAFTKSAAELAAEPAPTYALRLIFAEPDAQPRARLFEVLVQGQVVLPGLSLAGPDGPARRTVVRELRNLRLGDRFTLELRAAPGSPAPPVLSGLHLRAETAP
jgi:outer membrane protein assembly factor BamB